MSRPDLMPPEITVKHAAQDTARGYIFLGPQDQRPQAKLGQSGPEIVDNAGQPVWFLPRRNGDKDTAIQDFRPQMYKGKPVLTWWEDYRWVVMDESYRIIDRIAPGNNLPADLHDMVITPQGTALIIVQQPAERKLGGSTQRFRDEIIQEVQISTGRVLFQWDGLDHISPSESYAPKPSDPASAYDYLHLNSLSLDSDGNIIASARHTSAIYKIDRRTGKIIWRLGGKKSDFAIEKEASFSMQHDARWHPDGTISMFDNTSGATAVGTSQVSRGLVLTLDTKQMTASLKHSYPSPDGLLTGAGGNVQELPNGNVFVGWGAHGYFTEFSRSGKVRFDAYFTDLAVGSYRAYRFPWVGRPTDRPAVAGVASGSGMKVCASWNGATEVRGWRVLAGADPHHLTPVGQSPRNGFETCTSVDRRTTYVAVEALDSSGRALSTSAAAAVH